jgi:hypothetical protein
LGFRISRKCHDPIAAGVLGDVEGTIGPLRDIFGGLRSVYRGNPGTARDLDRLAANDNVRIRPHVGANTFEHARSLGGLGFE